MGHIYLKMVIMLDCQYGVEHLYDCCTSRKRYGTMRQLYKYMANGWYVTSLVTFISTPRLQLVRVDIGGVITVLILRE